MSCLLILVFWISYLSANYCRFCEFRKKLPEGKSFALCGAAIAARFELCSLFQTARQFVAVLIARKALDERNHKDVISRPKYFNCSRANDRRRLSAERVLSSPISRGCCDVNSKTRDSSDNCRFLSAPRTHFTRNDFFATLRPCVHGAAYCAGHRQKVIEKCVSNADNFTYFFVEDIQTTR